MGDTTMTNHDVIILALVGGFAVQIVGLVILGLIARGHREALLESQRLTRAVAGLVYQETAKILGKLESRG
jgi:hypothetical protein